MLLVPEILNHERDEDWLGRDELEEAHQTGKISIYINLIGVQSASTALNFGIIAIFPRDRVNRTTVDRWPLGHSVMVVGYSWRDVWHLARDPVLESPHLRTPEVKGFTTTRAAMCKVRSKPFYPWALISTHPTAILLRWNNVARAPLPLPQGLYPAFGLNSHTPNTLNLEERSGEDYWKAMRSPETIAVACGGDTGLKVITGTLGVRVILGIFITSLWLSDIRERRRHVAAHTYNQTTSNLSTVLISDINLYEEIFSSHTVLEKNISGMSVWGVLVR